LECTDGARVKTVLASGVDTGLCVVASDERASGERRVDVAKLQFSASQDSMNSEVRCSFSDGGLHSRMPLVPTQVRFKRAGV
jgi:hypothetical protein